jgi:hypothetical protein
MDIVCHEEYILGCDMASVGKWFVTFQRILVPPDEGNYSPSKQWELLIH